MAAARRTAATSQAEPLHRQQRDALPCLGLRGCAQVCLSGIPTHRDLQLEAPAATGRGGRRASRVCAGLALRGRPHKLRRFSAAACCKQVAQLLSPASHRWAQGARAAWPPYALTVTVQGAARASAPSPCSRRHRRAARPRAPSSTRGQRSRSVLACTRMPLPHLLAVPGGSFQRLCIANAPSLAALRALLRPTRPLQAPAGLCSHQPALESA